jgi:AAA15 family ATPase/GTPase
MILSINFLDKNDKITPIIVIAGINGSGKTKFKKSIVYLAISFNEIE